MKSVEASVPLEWFWLLTCKVVLVMPPNWATELPMIGKLPTPTRKPWSTIMECAVASAMVMLPVLMREEDTVPKVSRLPPVALSKVKLCISVFCMTTRWVKVAFSAVRSYMLPSNA